MKWNKLPLDPACSTFARENGISPITAQVLINRGLNDKDTVYKYLNTSSKDLPDPFLINDFERALSLLSSAIDKNKKIYIYGDYDADGVMSTVILYRALSELSADVHFYVPHRVYDGYGLNPAAVERIADKGCELLITCDNGISALEEIKLAKQLGMTVIVLDHHEPVVENNIQNLPPADAVVDCKRLDNTYPFRDMCAGGLCYRFVKEFYAYTNRKFTLNRELVTFAGIATVCDIVPLRGDNRIFVKNALYLLNNSLCNQGLISLVSILVKPGAAINTYTIGFRIGPCINAVGRLEAASEAVKLFVIKDADKTADYARLLVQKNKERQDITNTAAERLIETVDPSLPVQVLYDPDIHESVAGIIASRVKEKFYRPTLVITKGEEGCKGSGRSVEEYDLFKNMSAFRELFTKFGGHAMACGFSLPYENIDILRKSLNENCPLDAADMEPSIKLECEIPLDTVSLELAYELTKLEPFGKDNERPRFYTQGASLHSVRFVGTEKNIAQLTFLSPSGKQVRGIFFDGADNIKDLLAKNQKADYIQPLEKGSTLKINLTVDIAYTVEINHYNGIDYLQLNIADLI